MNTCRCGCGNPVGAGKQWIRGHNMRAMSSAAPASNDPDRGRLVREPLEQLEDPGEDLDGLGQWWAVQNDLEALTYEAAAAGIADDPDPARLPPGTIGAGDPPPVTRAVLADVRGKSLFWMLTVGEMWGIADPYCAEAAMLAAPKIARAAAPILCGSPQVVLFFTRSSKFMQWTELGMACKPVIAAVIAHHVTRSVQVTRDAGGAAVAEDADWSRYSAA
jgi:hypothetical protein